MIFSTKVNNKYFAINGIVREVGGKILETSNKKTTMERSTLIVKLIFSAESVGSMKTARDKNAMNTVGMINTTV